MIAVLLHDFPASTLGHGQQLAALVLYALPVRRNAGVDGDLLWPGHVEVPLPDAAQTMGLHASLDLVHLSSRQHRGVGPNEPLDVALGR